MIRYTINWPGLHQTTSFAWPWLIPGALCFVGAFVLAVWARS